MPRETLTERLKARHVCYAAINATLCLVIYHKSVKTKSMTIPNNSNPISTISYCSYVSDACFSTTIASRVRFRTT